MRNKAEGTPSQLDLLTPNDLWAAGFKSEFKLGNRQYCYPLTAADYAPHFLLSCEAFDSTKEKPVMEASPDLFKERGITHCDPHGNGLPFASPKGLYSLSKLSGRWLRLGICIERINRGHSTRLDRPSLSHRSKKGRGRRFSID